MLVADGSSLDNRDGCGESGKKRAQNGRWAEGTETSLGRQVASSKGRGWLGCLCGNAGQRRRAEGAFWAPGRNGELQRILSGFLWFEFSTEESFSGIQTSPGRTDNLVP